MRRWRHPGRRRLYPPSGHVARSDSGAAGGEEETESWVRVSKGDHIGLEKEDRCEKDTGEERIEKRLGSQLIGPRHAFLAH